MLKRKSDPLIVVADFSITTLLCLGAALQLFSQAWLPPTLSFALPLLYIAYRLGRLAVDSSRLYTGFMTNRKVGRWEATISETDDSSTVSPTSGGIVMFLLGARLNHPLGKLAPGIADVDKAFAAMWDELDKKREKWGYLGKSSTLWDISDSEGVTTHWITYWKDSKGLQAFASSPTHLLGQKNYLAKKYPYLGIMHEMYYSPKGCWETIYNDCPPMGLGKARYIDREAPDGLKLQETLHPLDPKLSMFDRMKKSR